MKCNLKFLLSCSWKSLPYSVYSFFFFFPSLHSNFIEITVRMLPVWPWSQYCIMLLSFISSSARELLSHILWPWILHVIIPPSHFLLIYLPGILKMFNIKEEITNCEMQTLASGKIHLMKEASLYWNHTESVLFYFILLYLFILFIAFFSGLSKWFTYLE